MVKKKIIHLQDQSHFKEIERELSGLTFTKNFRSATAEEWYIFLQNYTDPQTEGAAGKAIIHYDLLGNRDVFINTTVIFDDPKLYHVNKQELVYALTDEIINRLVGYADTLVSVHAGNNSFSAEYVEGNTYND